MISILYHVSPAGDLREIYRYRSAPEARLQAPNVAPAGDWLLLNGGGALWRFELESQRLVQIQADRALKANNDHGFTHDGRILFGSHHEGRGAQIYAMPEGGGAMETISSAPPSWWHGLSPDGRDMVYAAVRAPDQNLQIYRRALAGGEEHCLTQGPGHNDGPEFSADGGQIYWNSDRNGHAQIWMMQSDGQGAAALFDDGRVNWFPHPSPDGKWLIWISYPPGTQGHPYDEQVQVMIAEPSGANPRVIAEICGGQGSMNVPCWSPDGAGFYFMGYELEE